jgi:hypothetical protein
VPGLESAAVQLHEGDGARADHVFRVEGQVPSYLRVTFQQVDDGVGIEKIQPQDR